MEKEKKSHQKILIFFFDFFFIFLKSFPFRKFQYFISSFNFHVLYISRLGKRIPLTLSYNTKLIFGNGEQYNSGNLPPAEPHLIL